MTKNSKREVAVRLQSPFMTGFKVALGAVIALTLASVVSLALSTYVIGYVASLL